MYCPNCGVSEQEVESYCRNCGEFLNDYSARSLVVNKLLGGSSPSTQIIVNMVINLITILICFLLLGFLNGHYDAQEARTGEGAPRVIYLVYVFLLVIAGWQFLSLIIGARLRGKLGRKKEINAVAAGQHAIGSRPTNELLPEAGPADAVPFSVTEERTRILSEADRK
jgi:hypothetical protein